jgi:hypothetical protein
MLLVPPMKRSLTPVKDGNNVADMYLQAHKVKLFNKRAPRGTLGAMEIHRPKSQPKNEISNEANRKIEIN